MEANFAPDPREKFPLLGNHAIYFSIPLRYSRRNTVSAVFVDQKKDSILIVLNALMFSFRNARFPAGRVVIKRWVRLTASLKYWRKGTRMTKIKDNHRRLLNGKVVVSVEI